MALIIPDISSLKYLRLDKAPLSGYLQGTISISCMFIRPIETDGDKLYTTVSIANKAVGDSARLNILDGAGIYGRETRALLRSGSNSFDSCSTYSPTNWNGIVLRAIDTGSGWEPRCTLNGEFGPGGAASKSVDGLDVCAIGAHYTDTAVNHFTGKLAEVAIWTTTLDDWEARALSVGVSPATIRTDKLWAYLPLLTDIRDRGINRNQWSAYDDLTPISVNDLTFSTSDHPTITKVVDATYPILQEGFSPTTVDTTIQDYRATRIVNYAGMPNAQTVQWELQIPGGDPFTFYTDDRGNELSGSENVLGSQTHSIDLWLLPFQVYNVRTRQFVNGAWTTWTEPQQITALGYVNSYEKYQILNRGTIVNDVVQGENLTAKKGTIIT